MLTWKPCLIALGLGLWFGNAAGAQGFVPGGWAPQFGYQAFVGPGVAGFGVSGVYPGFGYGATLPGLTPYYGTGGLTPYYRPGMGPGPAVNLPAPSSRTVNAINPLIGAIRQTTRRKGSR
jgi:hypothetical protein